MLDQLSQPLLIVERLVLFLFMASCFGCDASSPASEDSFGLPGKGDESCDRQAPLCWVGSDPDSARAVMATESDILLSLQPLEALFEKVNSLDHKLNDSEREALDQLRQQLPAKPTQEEIEQVIKTAFETGYGRVLGGYWGAHATLYSEAFDAEDARVQSKADVDAPRAPIPSALPVSAELRPAFEALWAQGPLGQYLVTMLALSGVNDLIYTDIPIMDRDLVIHPPIDFDAARLVNRYARYAVVDSFFAGMASLIPVAGAYISIPYGVYAQFKQRARLAFELGRLYGLDPKDPNDFLIITQSLMTAQGFKELFSSFYKALMGAQGYRMISSGNSYLVESFSERRVTELVRLSAAQLGVYGIRILDHIKRKVLGQSSKALLGQITFGAVTLAEIAIDYFHLLSIGRELRYLFHPWGWATYLEGVEQLNDEAFRRCAYAQLISVARADGDVNEYEAQLMLEALTRPFHSEEPPAGAQIVQPTYVSDDTSWAAFIRSDRVFGNLEAALESGQPAGCHFNTWAKEDSFGQLTLLSWLELMAWVDRDLSPEEDQLLLTLGEAYSVSQEEERVYLAMRERVSTYMEALGDLSYSIWMWSRVDGDALEEVTSFEAMRRVWQEIR